MQSLQSSEYLKICFDKKTKIIQKEYFSILGNNIQLLTYNLLKAYNVLLYSMYVFFFTLFMFVYR